MRGHTRLTVVQGCALAAACVLLAGCGGTAAPKAADPEEQAVLTEKSAVALWKDYDARNNPVLEKAGPPAYDGSAYDVADTGPTLAADIAAASIDKVDKAKASTPFRHLSKSVYAPVRGDLDHALLSYVAVDVGKTPDPKSQLGLASMVRTGPDEDWMMETSLGVLPKDMPDPAAPGADSTPTDEDLSKALAVTTTAAKYVTNLRKPPQVDVEALTRLSVVANLRAQRNGTLRASGGPTFDGFFPTEGAGKALRVVRAKGGLLVVAGYRVTESYHAAKGDQINHNGELAKLIGKGPVQDSKVRYVGALGLWIPDQGKAKVISAWLEPTGGY